MLVKSKMILKYNKLYKALLYLAGILLLTGCPADTEVEEEEQELSEELMALIRDREEARKARDFKKADVIREELKKKGVLVEDTEKGTIWKRA